MNILFPVVVCILLLLSSSRTRQIPIPEVECYPSDPLPSPFEIIDFPSIAEDYVGYMFNLTGAAAKYRLIWIDKEHINVPFDTFGMPSYAGHFYEKSGSNFEAVSVLGAVLGMSLAGYHLNGSSTMDDFTKMIEGFYTKEEGLILNNEDAESGGSFWYDLWPHVLWYGIADVYRSERMMEILLMTAERWSDAAKVMNGEFNYTAFNFRSMKPVLNGQWREPDSAAGISFLTYLAYSWSEQDQFLNAAKSSMEFLQRLSVHKNPYYEVLLPAAVYTACRMNAELGEKYHSTKFLRWVLQNDSSVARGGWGTIAANWMGNDVYGLVGSSTDCGQYHNHTFPPPCGYAFAMNTFSTAMFLVPSVRYDQRYSRAIGKWLLNAVNAARLYYASHMPKSHQDGWDYSREVDPHHVIPYEGLRIHSETEWKIGPFATGDCLDSSCGKSNLGVYPSGYSGIFAGMIEKTSERGVISADCCISDFFGHKRYPTYLLYNPHSESVDVSFLPRKLKKLTFSLYEANTDKIVAESSQSGLPVTITIPGDSGFVVVAIPIGSRITREGCTVRANDITIRFLC